MVIQVKEHHYADDPAVGHPDVRTRLKDVLYFFLGNGYIQAAVQVSPSGEGTPLGLLIMNPEYLGRKREALTMDPESGLERTTLRIRSELTDDKAKAVTLKAAWSDEHEIPVVHAEWRTDRFVVSEFFYCPDESQPALVREVRIKNRQGHAVQVHLETGALQDGVEKELSLDPEGEKAVFLRYTLEASAQRVALEWAADGGISQEAIQHWANVARASFGSPLLDRYFRASQYQLRAAISHAGKLDGSIWQYNREWVRDQANIVWALAMAGEHEIARTMLSRLFLEFVTDEGDTIDSSRRRGPNDVELDQNGVLLDVLKNYVLWTGDREIIAENWDRIAATAEFPLREVFHHAPSGLMANKREYWERHWAYGIEQGMELAYQVFVSIGLSSAAALARMISRETEAARWEKEAARLKDAILNDPRYGLVDNGRFIKRRGVDGRVQDAINALPAARLPAGVPLAQPGTHFLNPDTSVVLPIITGFVRADSPLAANTLADMEALWNQAWEGGGYGRYHVSSEPDSPGPWPFPSLFVARASVETGDYEKVWRILRWLECVPGAPAASWFEFYGPRVAPPFPQVGIVPWTWAEMIILLIHHVIGVRPEADHLILRPRLLPGIEHMEASLPLRKGVLNLKLRRGNRHEWRTNGKVIHTAEREAAVAYAEGELWVEAVVA